MTEWDLQSHRLLASYKAASLVVFFVAMGWCVVFTLYEVWPLAVFEVALATVALVSWMLIRTAQLTAAFIFSEVAFLALTILFCLVFDVPSEQVPRVSHLFLLVLAMMGYISYLRTRSRLQLVFLAICLVFFVAFSSANFRLSFARPIADEFRVVGAWVNVIVATTLLCAFTGIMQAEISRLKGTARELRKAMRNDELELYFQPVLDRNEKIVGAEALLRWNHPTRGQVSPADFIVVAEENGLMPALGAWVLNSAGRTLSMWQQDAALSSLRLGVNVSVEQFKDEGFAQSVLDAARQCGFDPRKLTLELTESVFAADQEKMVPIMNELRAAGIGFAMDDFGTGFSSLGYLRNLPFDNIKIDRSFVREGLDTPRGAALVKTIIQIGQDLGMTLVAEGVETREQFDLLLASGCQMFQGYLFGRPLPLKDFEQDVRARGL